MAKSEDPRVSLARFRQRIDAIDRRLLALLNQRGRIARKIGAIKQTAGLAIVEPAREQQVVANMLAANTGPLPADSVERLFASIMIEMRNLQREGTDECSS
jgi:chorismate mutase-like protein